MRLFSIIYLCFLCINLAFGQAEIRGRIVDQTSTQPVAFVSVALYSASDSAVVAGAITDTSGRFVLTGIPAGRFTLKTFFVGYKPKTVSPIQLTQNQQLTLETLALTTDTKLLDEVNVSGQRANIAIQADRQVYRAAQFQGAVGGTATEVLKNLPGISVNAEGEVNLRGSNGFLVLLNGKPVQANAGTLLSQLPANSIESVEIITTPSAKYDPDGKAGIIAITTKKGTENGWSAQVNTLGGLPSLYAFGNLEKPARFGADATLNYRAGRWDMTLSMAYLRNDIAGRREGDAFTNIGNRQTRFPSVGERSFDRYTSTNRLAIAYTPSKQTSWTAGLYYGNRTEYRLADLLYANRTTDLRTGQLLNQLSYFNSNLVKKRGQFYTANLDYSHTFTSKTTLGAGLFYEYDYLDGFTTNRNLRQRPTDLTTYRDTLQYTITTTDRPLQTLRANVDLAIPLWQGRLEVGYLFRNQQDDGNFLYQNQNGNRAPLLVVPAFTGQVLVDNVIHSFYTQYGRKTTQWDYTAGLRFENSVRQLRINPANQSFKLPLNNLFPSLNVAYRGYENWQVKAGYSRRVQRTSNFALNPLPEREHSETLEQGDPNLLPEFVSLSELSASHTVGRHTLLATLYHQSVRNIVNRVNSVYADTILNRIFTNAGLAQRLGVELAADLQLTKTWKLFMGGTVYQYRLNGQLFQNAVQFNNRAVVYSLNLNTTLQLTPSVTMQGSINYLSQRITAQGEDSRFLTPNLSLKKSFLKNRLSIMAQWQNVGLGFLPTNEQRITTRGRDFFTTTNYIQEKDIILLTLSYNVHPARKPSKLPVSEGDKEF